MADIRKLKIIDFSVFDKLLHLTFGDIDDNDFTGDEWEKPHYEHNALPVYAEYNKGEMDIPIPYNWDIVQPCDGVTNSPYSMDDLKNRKVPIAIIIKPGHSKSAVFWTFEEWNSADDEDGKLLKIYMGDNASWADFLRARCIDALCNIE